MDAKDKDRKKFRFKILKKKGVLLILDMRYLGLHHSKEDNNQSANVKFRSHYNFISLYFSLTAYIE